MPGNRARLRPHRFRFICAPLPGISISGRMSSASIGPPGSWPPHPSTLRLSRLPQPPSRRIAQSLLPATPRGILRSRPAAPPQSTPAKRRAILFNQDHIYTIKTPYPRDLFDPALHSGSNRAVCAIAHVHLMPPLEPFAPQGAGSWLPLRRAARARGSACGRRRGAFPPDPRYSARDSLPPLRSFRIARS